VYFWLLRIARLRKKIFESRMTCNDESQLRRGIYRIILLAVLLTVYRQLSLQCNANPWHFPKD